MELDEKAEEILETLWIRTEEEGAETILLDELEVGLKEAIVGQLLLAGYITVSKGEVGLTARGLPMAANVVRRHRLAERLLTDVLSTSETLLNERACRFEHLLDRGLDDSICSLLGHPKVCPHGKPIPPGRCCLEDRRELQKVVSPLSQMASGESGKIAYIYATQAAKLQKLVSMGILPGAPVSLIQGFPSYVFQVRQTQFAVDKEIADAIYVRLVEAEPPGEGEQREEQQRLPLRHRFRFRKRRRGEV